MKLKSFMDDDGLEIGKKVPIKVRVEKRGDEMTIDLSEVSRQVQGLLQFRRDHRHCLRAGCFQMPDYRRLITQ